VTRRKSCRLRATPTADAYCSRQPACMLLHATRLRVGPVRLRWVDREQVDGTQDDRTTATRVLIVDDDGQLLDLLAFLVRQAGFLPVTAMDPSEAVEAFQREAPSVAVIDLNLRPGDGFQLLADLRERSPKLPILVLTGRASEDDKVRALDMGADDYVVKPFTHRELVARIRAQARHAHDERASAADSVLVVGAMRLDLKERLLLMDGQKLRLTGTEFRLLECLMRSSDMVVSTDALARYVWGYDDTPARDVVRVTVYRLRRKLGEDGPRLIETVPGVGLKLHSLQSEPETQPSV
jgi:DNA-binding response OmpR family regulator